MTHSNDYHDYVFKDGKLIGKFEEMYKHTSMPWHQDETAYSIFSEIDLVVLKQRRYERILDIGCGLGYFTSRLKGELKNSMGDSPHITAIDISPTAVKKARKRHPDIDFQVGDIRYENPFSVEAFDLVICKDLMWYVFDYLPSIISGIKYLLREDGFLYISQSFLETEDYVGKEVIKNPSHLRDIFAASFQLVWYADEWDSVHNNRTLAHILFGK